MTHHPYFHLLSNEPEKLDSIYTALLELDTIPAQRSKAMCFIYILWDGDEAVYVGQTTNSVWGRVRSHLTGRHDPLDKQFDSYSFIEVEHGELDDAEMYAIVKLQPKYNRSGIDAELLLPGQGIFEMRR